MVSLRESEGLKILIKAIIKFSVMLKNKQQNVHVVTSTIMRDFYCASHAVLQRGIGHVLRMRFVNEQFSH